MANVPQPILKISGYLEKKAKLRIGSPWKKYWFVLEGRLLLYYRSKDEYETLSPCKGSINLCPPCNVKPALSAAGVFQIECRASTVTLRAESRAEQERWMQALLAAIAQSKSNPNRMSHFRYSLDELPVTTADNKKSGNSLSRQNTMPYRVSSSPKRDKDIIGRLQQMGGQTYGGSLGAITKLANKEQKSESPNFSNKRSDSSSDVMFGGDDGGDKMNFKLSEKSQSAERIQSMLVENDQYSIIQEENSIDLFLDEKRTTEKVDSFTVNNDLYKVEDENLNVEERVTSFMLDNEQYVLTREENFIRDKETRKIEHLYERISSDSVYNNGREVKYVATNLYERISSSSSNSDGKPKISEQYSVVHKETIKGGRKIKENEYSLPINENTDHNKNSLLCESEEYVSAIDDKIKDSIYSDGLLYKPEYTEYAAIDKTKEQESLYEDPDQIINKQRQQSFLYQDIEPILPPRPEEKSEEINIKKSKFKMFLKKSKSDKTNDTPKPKPKRRSTSFIRKVWRRKAKSLDAEDDITYEPVDYELVEKQATKDKSDIQMLQELQKILETRKNMLQEKLNSGENHCEPKAENEESLELRTVTSSEEERPSLPPRQNSQIFSPHHDPALQSNKPVVSVEPHRINSVDLNTETIKTIDEILEDLEKEKDLQESRQKVKQLIEKFNDYQNEEEVVLRKKTKLELCKSFSDTSVLDTLRQLDVNRESDELTQLLEELSKVTCAPVLTPGVTSSLITPVLTDDEWLQIIPIRRRRLSDPDYDVPRPHRSLQLHHGRMKNLADNPIPATRFFGPILPPSTNDMLATEMQSLTSMDPDSLEIQHLAPSPVVIMKKESVMQSNNKEKEISVSSYTSHDYAKDDKVVYAQPKTVMLGTRVIRNQDNDIYSNLRPNNQQNYTKMNEKNEENVRTIEITSELKPILTKIEESFIDSLEPLAEASTAF